MPTDPIQRPRLFSLSEDERAAAIAQFTGGRDLDSPFTYEIMSPEMRERALDYYEMEVEWFYWEARPSS